MHYPTFPVLPCAYMLRDGDTERPCMQEPLEHLHTPPCERAPERHHAYVKPRRHHHRSY